MTDEELILKYVSKDKQTEAFEKLKTGSPVQYIIGNVEFCNCVINVNEDVLIPRFETEFLVEKTIGYIKNKFSKKIKIIDLGTGSGCIAIALKKALNADITALDISSKAIGLAKKNAQINKTIINFIEGDMTKKISGKYDCIISNPPYIPIDGFIEEKVNKYEPHLALYALDEGLYFYKKILSYAKDILNDEFLIALEIGDNQKEKLEKYILTNFSNWNYKFEKDLNNLDRYLFIFNE